MKSILPLFIFFLFFIACKQEKSTPVSRQEMTEKKMSPTDSEHSVVFEKTIFTTSTEKSIELITIQKSGSLNDFAIVAVDFPHSRDSLVIKDSDPFHEAVLKDLDGNGYDELYIITRSIGSGSYASIFGFASNQDLSLTSIYVPEISENDIQEGKPFYGYMGHDSIYFNENQLYRKFPIYKEGDANCCPTGGDKILSYQLKAGEATWKLELKN